MIVDAWIQQPNAQFLENPLFASLKKWLGKDIAEIGPEATLRALDEAEIDLALVSAWSGPQGDLISNQEVYDLTKEYPDRFSGLASVNLSRPMDALMELDRCVQDWGFKGLRILHWLWGIPCTHPLYYPLYAACTRLDVPVCLQVGLTGPLASSETGRPILVERVALDFPDLKIVCGHIGYPWHQEMIAMATKFPNVYIDTSAYKVSRYPEELIRYLKSNGKHKVLFGSNYPMITPKACLEELDALALAEDVSELFLGGNAARVFNL